MQKSKKKKTEKKEKKTNKIEKTEEILKKLEDIFKIDGTVGEACAYAGISEHLYYKRFSNDEEFRKRMERAQIYMFVMSRNNIAKAIKDGDAKISLEFLRRRDKRYSDKVDMNNNVQIANIEEFEV